VNNDVDQKESPLYRIRTRRAITEKLSNIVENVKTKFLSERLFVLPGTLIKDFLRLSISRLPSLGDSICGFCTEDSAPTCSGSIKIMCAFFYP
jgi:hypothetical protein